MSRTPLQFHVIVAVLTLWITRQMNGTPHSWHSAHNRGGWVQTLMRIIHSLLAFHSDVIVLWGSKSLNIHVSQLKILKSLYDN